MPDKKTKDLFKRAAEIASIVPEAMQGEAFNRALEELRGEADRSRGTGGPSHARKKAKRKAKGEDEATDLVAVLMEGLSSTDHPGITAKVSVLNRALGLLRAAREKCDIDGLSSTDLATVLTDKFRAKTSYQAVNEAFKNHADLVDRVKRDGGYVYRIMGPGEEYLDAPPDEEAAATPPRRGKSRAKKAKKKPKKVKKGRASNKAGSRTGSRPGPKGMLESLITEGYFNEPRTIGNMIAHIGKKKAHAYKSTNLSPALGRLIREGKLDREQDNDGQFEYQIK